MNMGGVHAGTVNEVLRRKLESLKKDQRIGGRNAVMMQNQRIPRKKFVEGEHYIQIIPAIIALPFNPTDLSDDSYSNENKFLFKNMSAYAGVKLLLEMIEGDPALATFVSDWVGIPVDNLKVVDDKIPEEVLTAFKIYRTADITSYPVQKFNFSDPAFKFGRSYRLTCDIDAKGEPVVEDSSKIPLAIKLWKMETALISAENKIRSDEYAADATRSQKELDQANKAAWKNRLISNPYYFGVVRSVVISADRQMAPSDESVSTLNNAVNFMTSENYFGINRNFLRESIEEKAGSKKDRYFDFFAFGVECSSKTKPEESIAEVARRTKKAMLSSEEDFTQQLSTFEAKYRAYRDEPSFWKEELLLNSVFAFGTISDELLLRKMKDDISIYTKAMHTQEIAAGYSSLIGQIDSMLSSELLMLNASGENKSVGLTAEELNPDVNVGMTNSEEAVMLGDNSDGETDISELRTLLQSES